VGFLKKAALLDLKKVMFPRMGVRLRLRGARSLIALGAVSLILVSVFVASASGSRATLGTTGGIWSSAAPTHSVSTTVYVSAVNCKRITAGRYAGQRAGAQLFGSHTSHGTTQHPFDFAGFYSYCNGNAGQYAAEFLISEPGAGILSFKPAGFPITPGDPLQITITSSGSGVAMTILDVNTHRHARAAGPGIGASDGWAAGVLPLFGGAMGKPFLTGAVPLLDQYTSTAGPSAIPGPTAFAPVVFSSFRVNGKSLGTNGQTILSSTWHGTAGSGATVTHVRNGAFLATGRLKPPKLGQSADVTPVSGTSLIEVLGTHHFVKLKKGEQIPNGSRIDANHGQVQVTLGLPHGKTETGVFYDGQFSLHQNAKSGATTATLTGADTSVCQVGANGNGAVSVASAAKDSTKPKGTKLRSLWANAHGSFTTKGSGGAAAVLGTKWFTEDTCAGTYFKVVRDKIKVTVFYPHRHTVEVTQGHSLFAPNETPIIEVTPVTTSNGRYNVHVSGAYSMVVVSATRPQYVDAAVAPQQPSGGNYLLDPDGSVNGIPRWRIVFHITPSIGHFQDWNVGVRLGRTLYVVKLRVN
jgi:hypothetical protein